MPNAFSKEERVAFENILEGFQDALVLSRNVAVYNTDQAMMERAGNTIWRPRPYIAQSVNSTAPIDVTSSFKDFTQLSVPATINQARAVPWTLNALELRDALQEGRLGEAARQKLASDINTSIMDVAWKQGTLVVKRTAAASGFDDVAQCEAIMNEQGVPFEGRFLALSTRDYNGMASNLQGLSRSFGNKKTDTAYERAYIGRVASFDTFKLDYANTLAKAVPGDSAVVINQATASSRRYDPKATDVNGNNVDNRTMSLQVTVAANGALKAGDCFTIAGVNSVHAITKQDTGQPKTFRIISITSGGGTAGTNVLVISPPIIAADSSPSDAQVAYQNVTATPANGAAFTFLNTAPATGSASVNPFWQRDALEILPGRFAVPSDAGVAVMRATTDQGLELVMQKFYDINTMKTKYRLDTLFGVVNKQPEMSGIMLFSQT